jgi:hypothetical protein
MTILSKYAKKIRYFSGQKSLSELWLGIKNYTQP